MYMGLYKLGVSLMGLFCGVVAFAFWMSWEELLFLLPVVWCYSFFYTHNLRRMTAEEFEAVEDRFFFEGYLCSKGEGPFTEKHRRLAGMILLAAGISVLWKVAMQILGAVFYVSDLFWRLGNSIPQIIVAVVILSGAVCLMKEPKTEEEQTEQKEGEEEKLETAA